MSSHQKGKYPQALKRANQERMARKRRLLATLRRQAHSIGHGFFSRETAPELFDLATTAKYRRGKFVRFGGMKFPLQHGWSVYVADPQTGDVLVSALAL